ncbi:MAG: hypothetical protein NT028_10220, partial [candidate division Zixibacteria bacterium]|nr:hypothetical protein [candidate division Zixibacteria bacterium]
MSTKKVLLLLSGLLFVTLFSVLAMTAEVKQSATMVAIENQQVVQGPVSRAACTMAKHNDVAAYYYEHYQTGVGTYTYFNPALMCPTPTYPFEISSFSFTLYAPTGYVWPAMVDVVVYALAQPPDSCRGPGSELCRYSLTANQATYGFPTVGSYAFPTPCYVNGPFYIGLEYTAGVEGSTPSVLVDNNVPPVVYCDNWMRWTDGLYYEWSNFWTSGSVGYPLFWVGGETVSLAQTGDVTVQFNGGGANNKVFIGEENTLQIFIKNPGGAIYGMSLGFGFTSAVPGFSWKTPYGNKPLPPKPKYVQEYGDAVDKFDVGGFHCDMPSPPTPFLMGGAADVAPLPVHATSTMLYDLKLIMPAAPGEYPGGFSIDNVFVPPAGSWKFDQLGGIDYPPTFQGNGNTSPEIPDAPPVYFDIVHRSDWDPGDPYKMHFPQLPNESGWDVNATDPVVLAEDWQCSETGWVKDIHFWGSWKNGIVGQIQYFNLMICSDIPANPPQIPYSRPGPSLWHRQIP